MSIVSHRPGRWRAPSALVPKHLADQIAEIGDPLASSTDDPRAAWNAVEQLVADGERGAATRLAAVLGKKEVGDALREPARLQGCVDGLVAAAMSAAAALAGDL